MGNVDVAIVDPHNNKDAVRPTVTKRNEVTWLVEYTPVEEGLHSVNVFFIGKPIPGSPYGVGVAPGKRTSAPSFRYKVSQITIYVLSVFHSILFLYPDHPATRPLTRYQFFFQIFVRHDSMFYARYNL